MKTKIPVLLLIVLLSACKQTAPVATLTATTLPPTPTSTSSPTYTPSPTQTPTPTPQLPLSGSGGGVILYTLVPATGGMQLNIINLDGSEDRKLIGLGFGINHSDWSPDGQKIAAVRYMDASFTTWSIHVFDADGSNLVRLTTTTGAADSEPAWSPDGPQILFSRIEFTSSTQYRSDLWLMNTDGSDQHMVVADGFAGKWSPDGKRIIYASNKAGNYEIYTSNTDGTDEHRLTNTSADESYPAWSPDGKQIAFSVSTGEWNSPESASTFEIYVMNADGTNVRQLTDNDASDGNPRWSPDGSLLAFTSDRAEPEHYDVYVMGADGTNVKQVTHAPSGARAINPIWRPLTPAQNGLISNLDWRLRQYTRNGEFNGSVLFAFEGGILLKKGYGLADRANNIPNTPQTRFMIASLTKQFTAMSILILQEQGKLNVQDRFCTYYPDCPAVWQDITIHQLLAHTSGIPTYTQFPAYPDWAALPKTPDEIIAFFINEPLLFRPGESWTYSNSGYTLLGYLIEHLSGLSYGDFLKTYIFTPLQMDDSGYDPTGIEDIAVGYYDKSNEPAFKLSPSIGFSDGGIYSTVGDLYRWDQALYTEQLLPQALLDQMFTPYGAAFDSPVPNYGYGWMIEEQDGHRVYFHQGAMDGFKAYIMRFPDDRITLIILSNQMDVTAGIFSREFASEMLSTLTK